MTEEKVPLEKLLAQYSVPPANAELRARILADASKALDPGLRRGDKEGFAATWISALREEILGWRPALPALGLALCLGIALGLMDETEETDLVQMAAYQQDFEEDE
jgi:hypothetical protein